MSVWMVFYKLSIHFKLKTENEISCTFNLCETTAQAQVPPLSGVGESCAVDVLHQLRQSLGEEGQVDFVPDVVLGPLEQVQQGLQERTQL